MATLTLTREQSRSVDAIAIKQYGFSGLVLMENAGRGVVDVLLAVDPDLTREPSREVVILGGKGNNAGDGFVIARQLKIRGIRSRVLLLASPAQLSGDALVNYDLLCHCDVPIADLSNVLDLRGALAAESSEPAWILDAMLGTGAQGNPREPYTTAIDWMNTQSARKLAVDVPSGLDCDTGQPAPVTVRADHTCTFVATKVGFLESTARDFLGQLHVVSIGTPPRLIEDVVAGG